MIITGNEVRQIREKMGLNVQQFSIKTDYTPQYIYGLESGKHPLSVQGEKVILLAFSRWSGAEKFGLRRVESDLRHGVKLLLNS
ncbi:helix-turn-helix domain-containing protein [Gammaproteobacteria bacterium]|nr:helix-turn-helix domain-containing protein [Gammaproteobacteria bacterium]